ncbi:MAG: hypothetical protein RJA33_459 [Actinomycetota bacterium]|jgi:hypothetical protein
MKSTRSLLITFLAALLAIGAAPVASAEIDPFPGVAYQAEIPGTRVLGQQEITCPAGSSRGIVADVSARQEYTVCNKSWRPAAEIAADAAFEQARRDGEAQAAAQSLAWNQAHPGLQKCFQWGPIVHANGISTASGGVCANPIAAPSGQESATVTTSESATSVVETMTVISPTPTPSPISTPAPVTGGFGGYAVVHPDGHVCGVIVANSSDPFNNGGIMPQEYMGCPSGSRFVFQTTPSESGNVAGWHGSNVTWDGSKFTITNGSSWIHISGGLATDSNGRVWDTGTGRVINAGNTPPPPRSDTSTVLSDTATVSSGGSSGSLAPVTDTSTVLAPVPTLYTTNATVDTATVVAPSPADDLDSLPEVEAEEEVTNLVLGTIVGNKTRIEVSSLWANTRLNIVATKKGSKKKYTYRFTTDSNGDYLFKSSVNLKGFTLVLFKGTEELDRDYV